MCGGLEDLERKANELRSGPDVMATMHVELVSVETPLWSGEATAVFARTVEGEIGILPGHAPLLGALAPGWIVRIERDGETSCGSPCTADSCRSERTGCRCSPRWPRWPARSTWPGRGMPC